MHETVLAGTRIRERRLQMGLKQSVLAEAVGISASYLNLIEHNRRRIGGKLVVALARALQVEPAQLSEGARTELIDGLRDAVVTSADASLLAISAPSLAEREPGWAGFVIAQHQRIETQADLIATLTDRLTHDPQLAASVHEVLSVITAIRSTAGILAGSDPIEQEWLTRFHRNMYEDSQRLAESAQALVAYLEEAEEHEDLSETRLAVEELELWLESQDYHVGALEKSTPSQSAGDLGEVPVAEEVLRPYLERYRRDAAMVPLKTLSQALASRPLADPLALADSLDVPFSTLMRRIATLPKGQGPDCGLVICDSSGTLTFRRPIEGFPIPRFGAGCPLWPLYQCLSQPQRPVCAHLRQSGYHGQDFTAFAIAEPRLPASFDGPQVFEATMLILPSRLFDLSDAVPRLPVGSSCRICPREDCQARREPSVHSWAKDR